MGDLLAIDLVLFVVAAFAASFVAGLAGFAFGIVAAAVWLYFLPPAQTAALIVAFGRIVQGVTVWKLHKAIKPSRLVPFLMGGAIGVPIGAEVLRWASSASLRFGIGVILAAFSTYSLIRPKLPSAGHAFSTVRSAVRPVWPVSFSTIWCSVRDWPPPEQRAVFQPIGVSVFLMIGLWLGGVLDFRKRIRARDGLAAGESRIRTLGPPTIGTMGVKLNNVTGNSPRIPFGYPGRLCSRYNLP
jgi:uncharacterized protein